MKVKRFLKFFMAGLLLSNTLGIATAQTTNKLADKKYAGLMQSDPGMPVYGWGEIKFTDKNFDMDFGAAGNLTGTYKLSTSNPPTVTLTMDNGNSLGTFTLKDNYFILEGNMLKTNKIWMIRYPSKLVEYTGDKEEITEYLTSSDGYNCFYIFETPQANLCATADAVFTNDTYKFVFETPMLKKVFPDTPGSWSMEGDTITLTDAEGKTTTGKIYNNGNFIKFNLGRVSIPGVGSTTVTVNLVK